MIKGSLRIWLDGPSPASGPERRAEGKLTRVDRLKDRIWKGTLEGKDAVVTFGIDLPEGARLPFEVGDALVVKSRFQVLGIHPVSDGAILRSKELVAAAVDTGDGDFAPGWKVSVGDPVKPPLPAQPEQRIAQSLSHFVRLSFGVEVVEVADAQWKRFTVLGRPWAASGRAVRWEPNKPLPPDGRAYHAYYLLRL